MYLRIEIRIKDDNGKVHYLHEVRLHSDEIANSTRYGFIKRATRYFSIQLAKFWDDYHYDPAKEKDKENRYPLKNIQELLDDSD